MRKLYLLSICLTIFLLKGFTQKIPETCYKNINSDDFNLLIETKEVILIDVRFHKEFRKERLNGAKLASSRESLIPILEKQDKNIFVLVYCDEGDRSETASQIICNELEFNNVYNLKRGIIDWKKKDYPIDYSRITKKKN